MTSYTRSLVVAMVCRLSVPGGFCNNCAVKDKIVPANKEDQKELEAALLDGLLKSYKIVDLKLYSKVRKELEKVHGEQK
jgi:hypothetical protein